MITLFSQTIKIKISYSHQQMSKMTKLNETQLSMNKSSLKEMMVTVITKKKIMYSKSKIMIASNIIDGCFEADHMSNVKSLKT